MLKSLTIKGFRCFRELRVEPLTRVNLFVGKNNSGKTSLLEAAELLAIGGIEGLVRSAVRRDERVLPRLEPGEEVFKEYTIDPSHLFFGHRLKVGDSFKIENDKGDWIQCTVALASYQDAERPALVLTRGVGVLVNLVKGLPPLTISPSGGVLPPPRWMSEENPRVNFLAAEAIDVANLGELWDLLVLTPQEQEVTEALRVLDSQIERLAFLSESQRIFLKLKGGDQRLPLGSLGGGVRHLLALVLHLFSARGGFLLVDEIDTGLHYSVMVDMWRLVVETAKRLDVQVLATTHSLDCVRALARLRNKYPETAEEVRVHRVDKEASKTVVYDMDEIVVAAESHIEVR
jgi:putative AbiEii toxin of type IV toxin-antitoxin system/AAA ATPase-like protein